MSSKSILLSETFTGTFNPSMSVLGLHNRNEITTFPPRKKKINPSGSKFEKLMTKTLGGSNFSEAVKLPSHEDINEWLAMNTVDFYNHINILYATLEEFCTSTTCPIMNAGSKYEYKWADGIIIKKGIMVSAPKYVEYLMNWIEAQLDNETVFPQNLGEPFPSNFEDVLKKIYKRLFRVYAHIYHSHFERVVSLREEAHLNTCFKHFVFFATEFKLVDKADMDPLCDLVETILNL